MLIQVPKSKPQSQKEYKQVPVGSHLGRLYQIIDTGTQQNEWDGEIKYERKLIFKFELHGDDEAGNPLLTDDGKPLSITVYYNKTLHEKATLRKNLTSWLKIDFDNLEEDFNMKSLLGKFAMVNVILSKTGKSKVDNLSSVPTIIAKAGFPEGANELFMFDLDAFDSEKYAKLSNGYKEMIEKSPEYRAIKAGKVPPKAVKTEEEFNDDIPF
jgi:hypothetical protein